jgi:hypothetical protein
MNQQKIDTQLAKMIQFNKENHLVQNLRQEDNIALISVYNAFVGQEQVLTHEKNATNPVCSKHMLHTNSAKQETTILL